MTFYFDRNFGKSFPEALRAARPPFSVEFHHDPRCKFKFAQDAQDDEWISKVAVEGWIIFSHDRKFHTIVPECAAIKQYNAGCFYLPGANSPTWDKVCTFMKYHRGIITRATKTNRPFIYELLYNGRFKNIHIP